MKILVFAVSLWLLSAVASAQQMPGLAAGKSAPTLQTPDQFGKEQTNASLMGRNGLVLLFFRSSDW